MRTRRSWAVPVIVVMGWMLLALTSPAQAQDASQESASAGVMQVVIDRFSPLVPTKGDTLRISGRVINTSPNAVERVRVGLRKSSAPLASRTDIAEVLRKPTVPPGGSPDDVELPGTLIDVVDQLPPGGRARFSIKIPLATLDLPEPGTYVLGIEALGAVGTLGDSRLADLRTFLPWYPPDSVAPVSITWLWPLADWPARTASGVLLDQRTPQELAPEGRLTRLVDAGAGHGDVVSWIADPEVLQSTADMSDGYLVEIDGRAVPGEAEEAAASWLSKVKAATSDGALVRSLPYADVDASALTRAELSTDVVRAVTTGPVIATSILGDPVRGGLYWAPTGRIDRPALNVLASAGITDIVLGSDTMPPTNPQADLTGAPITALPTSVGSMRAILADSELTRIVSTPPGAMSDAILGRQQFLAHTALIAQNLAPTSPGRSLVVAPDNVRWDPSDALVGPLLRSVGMAPWLTARSLDDLLAQPMATASRQRGGYGDKARESELEQAYMDRVKKVSGELDAFTSIIDDPTGIVEPYSAALLRSESSAWRTRPNIGIELVNSTAEELDSQTSQVRVLSAGTITFSGDTGRVPVTIANDLDRSVTVGLSLRGVPALRLESEPLTGIQIEPGKMASVDLEARVVGGDPLPVEIQLISPEGEVFATPTRTTVTSTAYARAAAWVVAVAFLAIVVFVIVGVTRRIHAAQSQRGEGKSDRIET